MGLFDSFKRKPTIPPQALTFWVHRKSHLETLKSLTEKAGREPMQVRPICDAFSFTLALSSDQGPISLKSEHLEGLKMTLEQATRQAVQNVSSAFQSVARADGLAFFETQSHIAGAGLLFAPILIPHLALRGTPVAMVPHADLILFAGEEDENALRQMAALAEMAYGSSSEFRSLRAVRFNGTSFDDWLPPEGHPLRGTFKSLESKTKAMEVEAVYETCGFAKHAPLAHLAVLPPEAGGGLLASWARDTSVLIPKEAERVVLLDTEDASPARVDVDFLQLQEVVPEALEPLAGEESDTTGWPSFFRLPWSRQHVPVDS